MQKLPNSFKSLKENIIYQLKECSDVYTLLEILINQTDKLNEMLIPSSCPDDIDDIDLSKIE